ncbi:hypothetical protein AVEN_246828-1 [Araneus ventricosus]|uniref:Uncharacterized protein n=1 Tax=Araneus ventricosus TaxID=182803 RepID=A0A4Y2TCE6_ARAVE|nr:hypothetical protein AVEN_29681-1 [Araneus ventricosus]GBN96780.1 hypothetical protein AVEN_246828-1 [Araneus ventricosus]
MPDSLYLKVWRYIFSLGDLKTGMHLNFVIRSESHLPLTVFSPSESTAYPPKKRKKKKNTPKSSQREEKKKEKRTETMLLGHPCVKVGGDDGETKDAEEQ